MSFSNDNVNQARALGTSPPTSPPTIGYDPTEVVRIDLVNGGSILIKQGTFYEEITPTGRGSQELFSCKDRYDREMTIVGKSSSIVAMWTCPVPQTDDSTAT